MEIQIKKLKELQKKTKDEELKKQLEIKIKQLEENKVILK